ncbi:hypothetical protein [Natrarchaeobaculum sulfurireducens]|uniref:Uncharacterized protein n=1 Tax=Natrarchaeobaculum sulfurireducens TaxID=2044521 RepID=A0A346PFS3_9EURY|nr:hypothetical protein [Natrarchaeobaculum sulfurireducens]AXR78368.1 hypothetical protein AArc1_2050 [Natrarchaeobaculum sulfurireducens]
MTDTGSERPAPPDDLDADLYDLLEALSKRDLETVSAVATYVTELEAWLESTERDATYPDDVPERATVSVMEVAGTSYRYYQWREGDEIRSKTVELE